MTALDLDRIKGLRALAALLREPLASELIRQLDAASGSLPAIVEQPQAIRYRLLLNNLAARIQAGDREAALLARIEQRDRRGGCVPPRACGAGRSHRSDSDDPRGADRSRPAGWAGVDVMAEVCARFDVLDSVQSALSMPPSAHC